MSGKVRRHNASTHLQIVLYSVLFTDFGVKARVTYVIGTHWGVVIRSRRIARKRKKIAFIPQTWVAILNSDVKVWEWDLTSRTWAARVIINKKKNWRGAISGLNLIESSAHPSTYPILLLLKESWPAHHQSGSSFYTTWSISTNERTSWVLLTNHSRGGVGLAVVIRLHKLFSL